MEKNIMQQEIMSEYKNQLWFYNIGKLWNHYAKQNTTVNKADSMILGKREWVFLALFCLTGFLVGCFGF